VRHCWRQELKQDIQQSVLVTDPPADVDEFFTCYSDVLRSLLDKHVPVQSVAVRRHLQSPWFDGECREVADMVADKKSAICLQTCRKPGFKQALSKFDLMEFPYSMQPLAISNVFAIQHLTHEYANTALHCTRLKLEFFTGFGHVQSLFPCFVRASRPL